MVVKIYRVETGDQGTFGVLTINGEAFCVTLEPEWLFNIEKISCIPAGVYLCRRVDSPTYGITFEITDVEGRTHVLFHAGNWDHNSEACVLLGEHYGKLKGDRAILNSGNTFDAFMERMVVDSFALEIMDAY